MNLPIQIKTDWDADLHIHNRWSVDIPNGPKAKDYLKLAEENKIHIGFLDHFELKYKNLELYPHLMKDEYPAWPWKGDKWNKYLDEMDDLKYTYPFVSSGLEIAYFPDIEDEIKDFLHEYGDSFDFFVGSLHEFDAYLPVTQDYTLKTLIKKYGTFEKVIDLFFDMQVRMIKTGLFNAVAHIDTIYRYCGSFIPMKDEFLTSSYKHYTRKTIELCIEKNIWVEYNLSGRRFPINRPLPPTQFVKEYLNKGGKFYVGSDSHSISTFKRFIPWVKEANNLLRTRSH